MAGRKKLKIMINDSGRADGKNEGGDEEERAGAVVSNDRFS